MATTFAVSRDDIINRALRLCGTYDATNPPTSQDFQNVGLAFNMMIKAWILNGQPMWKVVETVLPLVTPVNTYQIGPYATGPGALVTTKILKIQQAFIRLISTQFDTPIDQISIQNTPSTGVRMP